MRISQLIKSLNRIKEKSGDLECYNLIHTMDSKVEYDEDRDTQFAEVEQLEVQYLCNFTEDTVFMSIIKNEDFLECKDEIFKYKKICAIL